MAEKRAIGGVAKRSEKSSGKAEGATVSSSPAFASVDLGGTNIHAAVAGADGTILAERKVPTRCYEGFDVVLNRIIGLVQSLADEAGCHVDALGMGVPGLANLQLGTTLFLPSFPGNWRNVPVAAALSKGLDCPVYLLNDVRMATLGELRFGSCESASGIGSMVFFAIGTGIGGGLVIDGQLRLGALGAAGELGHQTILPDGPPCGCGSRGCLETLASGPAIIAEGVRLLRNGWAPKLWKLTEGDLNRVTPKEIAAAAVSDDKMPGDPMVRRSLERIAEYLGIGIANVVTAVHPDLVVLGGGVAKMGEVLLAPVRRTLRERVRMFPVDDLHIELSALGDCAGILGGIALAMQGGVVPEVDEST